MHQYLQYLSTVAYHEAWPPQTQRILVEGVIRIIDVTVCHEHWQQYPHPSEDMRKRRSSFALQC